MLKLEIDIDVNVLTEKFSASNLKQANFTLSNQVLADSNNYVPLRDGTLRATGHVVGEDSVVWETPYANAQYQGMAGHKKGFVSDKQRRFFFWALNNGMLTSGYTTPGTGPFWDKVAKGAHMPSWEKAYIGGLGLD